MIEDSSADASSLQPAEDGRALAAAPPEPRAGWARAALPVAIVAIALAVNLTKAVHIDDAAHLAIARWILDHPWHPMSGTVHWGVHPAPIHAMNQPPGLFYLIAAVMAIFGDDAMGPQHLLIAAFVAIGVIAYLDLARRLLSPRWASLTAVALFLGPAFLPSQNLMTDVPLLALWLAFFAVLDRAGPAEASNGGKPEPASLRAHGIAALLAAAACFVKYTSLVLVAVLALDLILHHRRRLPVLLVPVSLLVAWSLWNLADYGGVHLLDRPVEVGHSPSLPAALGIMLGRGALWVMTLGAVAPFAMGFAPQARTLRRPGFWILAVSFLVAFTVLGQVAAALVPDYLGGESVLHSALRGIFLGGGIVTLQAAMRAAREGRQDHDGGAETRRTRLLLAWLWGTFVFIVVLSPFIAVRHVLLVLPAILLLLARGAGAVPSTRVTVAVRAAVPLALAVALADAHYAEVYRDFAREMSGTAHAQASAGRKAWTVGHWGWQYYAERAGLSEYDPGTSVLRSGDVLIRPRIVDQQAITASDRQRLTLVETRVVPGDGLLGALRTVTSRQGFYAVWGGLPWTFTREPLEVFEIWSVTDPAEPAAAHAEVSPTAP